MGVLWFKSQNQSTDKALNALKLPLGVLALDKPAEGFKLFINLGDILLDFLKIPDRSQKSFFNIFFNFIAILFQMVYECVNWKEKVECENP